MLLVPDRDAGRIGDGLRSSAVRGATGTRAGVSNRPIYWQLLVLVIVVSIMSCFYTG